MNAEREEDRERFMSLYRDTERLGTILLIAIASAICVGAVCIVSLGMYIVSL